MIAKMPPKGEVIERIKRRVIGQDAFIEGLVNQYALFLRRVEALERGRKTSDLPRCNAILGIAPTGVGKTFSLNTFGRAIGAELFIFDSSQLTGEGWHGTSVKDEMRAVAKYQKDHPGARVVVVFDEADKLVKVGNYDASGFNPTENILKILEPGIHVLSDPKSSDDVLTLDSDRIFFVFIGAFAGIESVVEHRLMSEEAAAYGPVSNARRAIAAMSANELRARVCNDDLREWGFTDELLGRIGCITSLRTLTEEELRYIVNGKDYMSSIQQRFSNLLDPGCEIVIDDLASCALAKAALKSNQGARALEPSFIPVASKIEEQFSADLKAVKANVSYMDDTFSVKYEYAEHERTPWDPESHPFNRPISLGDGLVRLEDIEVHPLDELVESFESNIDWINELSFQLIPDEAMSNLEDPSSLNLARWLVGLSLCLAIDEERKTAGAAAGHRFGFTRRLLGADLESFRRYVMRSCYVDPEFGEDNSIEHRCEAKGFADAIELHALAFGHTLAGFDDFRLTEAKALIVDRLDRAWSSEDVRRVIARTCEHCTRKLQ